MVIINKDITTVTNGAIIHQVNCQYKMGSGVALEIRNKYPQHYNDYLASELYIGKLVITNCGSVAIIGMCSQDRYGNNGVYTDSTGFENCLNQIASLKVQYPDLDFYMPYKIGCCRGGGNWEEISCLIEKITPFIILCKL